MKKFIPILLLPLLAACATTDYDTYLKAQAEANRQALEAQKPLIKITAQPGQQITGLQSLEVFTPQQMPVIQQARPSEWAAVFSQGIGVIGTVGGIYYGGKAAASLASEIRQAGTAGYQFIQAPGATTTTTSTVTNTTTNTMSGSTGVLGSGTYTYDATHAPTVVNPVVVQPAVVQPAVVNPVVVPK